MVEVVVVVPGLVTDFSPLSSGEKAAPQLPRGGIVQVGIARLLTS